jgi:membrane-associated PAP2 superfamily phosphatase
MTVKEDRDLRSSPRARFRTPIALATACAASFLVLAVLVELEVSQALDVAVRDHLRPDDEWGTTQVRVDVIVESLKPRNVAVLIALVGLAAAWWRRSWRPAVYTVLVSGAAAALTLLAKFAAARTDPHHEMTARGGSFPSGHVVMLVVFLGLTVLLVRYRSRWWDWLLVAAVGAAMAFSLVVQAAHWLTDVVGGGLLAVAVLAAASLSSMRTPGPRRPPDE